MDLQRIAAEFNSHDSPDIADRLRQLLMWFTSVEQIIAKFKSRF